MRRPLQELNFFRQTIQVYSSGWILNFGVVPLLRLSFFLLDPLFLSLLARRVFVTLVLETIIQLPFFVPILKKKARKQRFKERFLPAKAHIVKTFLFLLIGFLQIFFINLTHSEVFSPSALENDQTLILSIGEQKELTLPSLQKFSVGRKDVISYKYLPAKNLFILKGKKLGHTDLLIWDKKQKKRQFTIYVLSKIQHLRFIHLAQILKSMGLSIQLQGPLILGFGSISSLEHYLLLRKLLKKYPDHLFLQVHLRRGLRNQILGQIYAILLKEYVHRLKCQPLFLKIACFYDESSSPGEKILQSLKSQYEIDFTPLPNQLKRKNYLMKMKLVQLEKLDGEELHLGLHKLTGSLDELFSVGVKNLFLKNEFLLSNSNINLSTLAETETVLRIGVPATLEMGNELQVTSAKNEKTIDQVVHWKFAGLKIKLQLSSLGDLLQLRYFTEFTRPLDQNIVGNKESSSLSIKLGKAYQIFQIGYKTQGKEISFFPGLGSIPILGSLFQSKSAQSTYKKIHGIIFLEELTEKNHTPQEIHHEL